MEECPKFNDFANVIEAFKIPQIDIDCLYEEYVILKEYLKNENNNEIHFEKRWIHFLNIQNVPNFENLINFVFAIPHSNAHCERIFSLMFNAWRKERNHLLIPNLEAELQIKHNFQYTCQDFYNFALKNNILLNKVKSSEKYS